jgi:hypothetical protein
VHAHYPSGWVLGWLAVQYQHRGGYKSPVDDLAVDDCSSSKFSLPHVAFNRHLNPSQYIAAVTLGIFHLRAPLIVKVGRAGKKKKTDPARALGKGPGCL